jgi:hypothetical protein
MRKNVFRPAWLIALGGPALITVLLSAPFAAWALLDFSRSIGAALVALVPLAWFCSRYLAWRATSWTFDTQAKALVIRSGILNRKERRIPLNFPPQATYSQSLIGRILNFGTVELSSFGGPVTFRHVGDLRAFKQALTSPGLAPAKTGPPVLLTLVAATFVGLFKLIQGATVGLIWLVGTIAPLLVRVTKRLFDQTRAGISVLAVELMQLARAAKPPFRRFLTRAQVKFQPSTPARTKGVKTSTSIQEDQISAFQPSWDGLIAFSVDFVLPFRGGQPLSQDFTGPDRARTYYRIGVSSGIADFYLWALGQARIVVPGTDGRAGLVLCGRIRTADDVVLRIPRRAFEELADRYAMLSRLEVLSAIKMQPSSTLRLIRDRKNGQLSKQASISSEPRTGDGRRPAA